MSTTSTTKALPAGPPGDSPGEWVKVEVPRLPAGASAVSVSDQALLIETWDDVGSALYAMLFESGVIVELPLGAEAWRGADIDGLLAVWWEGEFDEYTAEYISESIYAYLLPNGPKVEVVGEGLSLGYPQVADGWVTWTEGSPWELGPDEYWKMPIHGVQIDVDGTPVSPPTELAPSAIANILGDSVWYYSLSDTHLAWEQATAVGAFDAGSYFMDLGTLQPLIIGNEAWRPSIGGSNVVYYRNGLKAADLATGREWEIDPLGDYPAAAPTFAVYFRSIYEEAGVTHEIVARGLTGRYEQVLAEQPNPPWLSPYLSAAARHIAFVANDEVHLFEWHPSVPR